MAVYDPILDPINLTTLPEVNDTAAEDLFFMGAPLQAHLRYKCLVPFKGGAFSRNLFQFAPLNGGAYARGVGGFSLIKPVTLGGTVFDPRYYVVMIIEYLEDIEVLNTGNLAVFDLVELDVANAHQTLTAIIALDLNQNGQTTGRTININGWVEAYNDGIMPSYDGNIYTSYGTAARNGNVNKALNGNVYFGGTSTGAGGTLQYPQLNTMYNLGRRGADEIDLIVGNKPIVSFAENRIQTQQRFGQDGASMRDPYWGATGFRFKNAVVLIDDYFPTAVYPYGSSTNGGLGSNLTSTISYTVPTGGAYNGFPAANATLTVGEVLVGFNTTRLMFRISDSAEFGGTPTDFIRVPDGTRVASQLKLACNFECTAPWTGIQGYGWVA